MMGARMVVWMAAAGSLAAMVALLLFAAALVREWAAFRRRRADRAEAVAAMEARAANSAARAWARAVGEQSPEGAAMGAAGRKGGMVEWPARARRRSRAAREDDRRRGRPQVEC